MPDDICIVSCSMSVDFMTVRIQGPNEAMAALGIDVREYRSRIVVPSGLPESTVKVLIIQRPILSQQAAQDLLRTALERDWIIITEFDDHPELLPPQVHTSFMQQMGMRTFEACHGVQTTTPVLADVFRRHNPCVADFDNQIFHYPLAGRPVSDKVRLIFAALNRQDAWKPLLPTLNAMLARHDNVELKVIQDKALFDALETDRKHFHDAMPYDQYLKHMLLSDIALMPLVESPQTACKSDVKFLEASICGAATIASPTVYKDTIIHGETGYIANTPDEWETCLEELITNKPFRQHMARKAKRYVRENRMLMQHIHKRIDWYKDLWENRAEINARLRARFPEATPGHTGQAATS